MSYGQNVLSGIISGRGWLENKIIFPRIVYCDFTIRYLGDNTPNYTVRESIESEKKSGSFVAVAIDRYIGIDF